MSRARAHRLSKMQPRMQRELRGRALQFVTGDISRQPDMDAVVETRSFPSNSSARGLHNPP